MNFEQKLVKTIVHKFPADTLTSVAAYLRLRERYAQVLLLESNDFQADDNCFSYICFEPIANFSAEGLNYTYNQKQFTCHTKAEVFSAFKAFKQSFTNQNKEYPKGVVNGLFGYCSFSAVEYFEDLKLTKDLNSEPKIPSIQYHLYKNIIVFNHYRQELYLLQNYFDLQPAESEVLDIMEIIHNLRIPKTDFAYTDSESSNFTDNQYLDVIAKCKEHIQRGDVFQIVPSRRFFGDFKGDDFNVYRALRSINPSPYLFYFDYADFRIFGSSPEAELITRNGRAEIFPIAGSAPRSANAIEDQRLVAELLKDPKENAEHVMLVDLARNDLSKHCLDVRVDSFREVHFYSHIVHLVSKVSGMLKSEVSAIDLLADTFPAGTLSGAPKYRALQLIDELEPCPRGFYAGALGYLGFNNDSHHAIIIRSFLSKDSVLYRQAGGGIVIDSDPEKELLEVKNKLAALKQALSSAQNFVSGVSNE